MKKDHRPERNLLALKPKRNLEWESGGNDLIVLLVPKFRNRYIVKWFVPLLAKPTIKLKLDTYGSYVWSRCDGETTVTQIGEDMATKFGEALEPMYERIGKFIATLEKDKFIDLDDQKETEKG